MSESALWTDQTEGMERDQVRVPLLEKGILEIGKEASPLGLFLL